MNMQEHVDHQLMTFGSYNPLEWLLDTYFLDYADYEAWRMGNLDVLDRHINFPTKELIDHLLHAEKFCLDLNLIAEQQDFQGWGQNNATKNLTLSQHNKLIILLSQRWVKKKDVPQMDLFMDNPAVTTENTLIEALSNRHWTTATKLLDQLHQQNPNHAFLNGYTDLVTYGNHTDTPIDPHLGIIDEERLGLEQELAPLARQLLQQSARDYLTPAWQRIALSLDGYPYNAAHPESHASYAWEQAQNWHKVEHCILSDKSYRHHGDLLFRLSLAYYYLRKRELSLITLIQFIDLSTTHPDTRLDKGLGDDISDELEQRLNQYPDTVFISTWQHFMDLEAEPPFNLFLGWLLLNEPGLSHHIHAKQKENITNPSFLAVHQLQVAKRQGNTIAHTAARKTLNEINPLLLTLHRQNT